MPTPHKPIDLSHLSPADRIDLVQELWDSIHDDAQAVPLTAEQKAELDAATLTWNPVLCGPYPGKKCCNPSLAADDCPVIRPSGSKPRNCLGPLLV